MLEASHISIILSRRQVLDDVSLSLRPGEMVAVIGANGAGKTSLLRALAGLIPTASGEVRLEGRGLTMLAPMARARQISFLPQGGDSAWPIAVEHVVALGRYPWRRSFGVLSPGDQDAIERALGLTDTAQFRKRAFAELSHGEKARVLLARALATEAPCLLADEPVAALDPAQALDMLALLASLAHEGRAVLCVVHDLALATRFFPRIVLLHHGKLLADGASDQVLSDEHVARAFGIRIRRHGGTILTHERL